MNTHFLKKMLARLFVIGAGVALLGTAAIANPLILDWRVIGTGTVGGTCDSLLTPALASGCTSISTGTVLGQHVGSGSYTLSLTTGSNNSTGTDSDAKNSSSGKCFPANGTGVVTAANGSIINFNTVGWLCEEGAPGTPYHYNGTYRITSGTDNFASVAGGGSLAATFETGATNVTYMKIDGTIKF